MSAVTSEEQATPPDSRDRSRPPGCAAFSSLRRCSSVTDPCGYALSSRLGGTKNRQQRGMAEFFNRLLSAVKENGNPGNNHHCDADIEPHKRAARSRFPAAVGRTIK